MIRDVDGITRMDLAAHIARLLATPSKRDRTALLVSTVPGLAAGVLLPYAGMSALLFLFPLALLALPIAAMCIGEHRRYLLAFVSVTSINVGFLLRLAVIALAHSTPNQRIIDADIATLFLIFWLLPLAASLFLAWLTYRR